MEEQNKKRRGSDSSAKQYNYTVCHALDTLPMRANPTSKSLDDSRSSSGPLKGYINDALRAQHADIQRCPPPPLTLLTYSYLELLLSSVFQEETELLRRFGYIRAYHYQASLGGGDMGRKIGRRAESGGWQGRQRRKSGANGDPVCSCAIAWENRGRRDPKKKTWSG